MSVSSASSPVSATRSYMEDHHHHRSYMEDPSDPRVKERERNRRLLHHLDDKCHREFAQIKNRFEAIELLLRTEVLRVNDQVGQKLTQHRSELAPLRQELTAMLKDGMASCQREVATQSRSDMAAFRKEVTASFQNEVGGVRQDVSLLKAEAKNVQNDVASLKKEWTGFQSTLSGIDFKRIGSEVQEFRKALDASARKGEDALRKGEDALRKAADQASTVQQLKKKLDEVRQGVVDAKTRSEHGLASSELARVELRTHATAGDVADLRKQLLDRGVLGPPKPPEPPQEDEQPPVGTIELEEDIFAARLLMKLGFCRGHTERMLAKQDASSEIEDACSGESESESSMQGMSADQYNNVTGLAIPDVQKGTWGYFYVTRVWMSICACTTILQALILFVLLRAAIVQEEECIKEEEYTPAFSLMLYGTKALALLVLNFYTSKEVLGIMNYVMVGELLEPRVSVETFLTGAWQVLINIGIIATNFIQFRKSNQPSDIWLNMTAVSFIASLDADMIGVAKGGVFGHHIQKSLTDLNYQLNFMAEYPPWFDKTRSVVLSLVLAGLVSSVTIIMLDTSPVCAPA